MAIKLTPDELRELAAKLENNASEAINLANVISTNINQGTAGWEGEAKKSYVEAYEAIKPTLTDKLPELITNLASSLRNTAQTFEDTDAALAGR